MSTALLYYIYGIIVLQQILLNYAKPTNEKAKSNYNHYDNNNKYPTAAGEVQSLPAEQSNWLEKLKPQQAEQRKAKTKNHTVEFDCLLIDNDAEHKDEAAKKQWYRMSLATEPAAANSSSQRNVEGQKPKDCKNNNISKILNWLDTEDRRELQELVHQLVKTNDYYPEDVLEHTTAHDQCQGCKNCQNHPEMLHNNNSNDSEYKHDRQQTPDRDVLPDTLGVMNTFNHDDNVMTINSSKKLDNKLLKRIVHIVQNIE